MQPINNLISNIVYSGSKDNIKLTMINGKVLYQDGKFNIDENLLDLYKEVQEISDRLNKFNQKISKSQRLSNWEAPTLSDAQQEYAAIDAWACLKIYNYIKSGKFNPELSKYYIDIIDPTTNLENTDKNEKI